MTKTAVSPDQDALKRIGAQVRKRLEADSSIYKVPTDRAEMVSLEQFCALARNIAAG